MMEQYALSVQDVEHQLDELANPNRQGGDSPPCRRWALAVEPDVKFQKSIQVHTRDVRSVQ
jgi:hypothetical protein